MAATEFESGETRMQEQDLNTMAKPIPAPRKSLQDPPIKRIRELLEDITPETKDTLLRLLLDHEVYKEPAVHEVAPIIYNKAVDCPKFVLLLVNICQQLVALELRLNKNNVSNFRNAILVCAQNTFKITDLDDIVKMKECEISYEKDENKKMEMKIELVNAQRKFRERKFGNITFIGQLFLHNLLSIRTIPHCFDDLLKTVTEKPKNLEGYKPDQDSMECAVRLIAIVGRQIQIDDNQADANWLKNGGSRKSPFPMDPIFEKLREAEPFVSSRLKEMIVDLAELRENGWVPINTVVANCPNENKQNTTERLRMDLAKALSESQKLHNELIEARSESDENDRKIAELEKKYKRALMRFGRDN